MAPTNKRTRRHFTDDFKREMIFKLENNQVSRSQAISQIAGSNPAILLERWERKFKGKPLPSYMTHLLQQSVSVTPKPYLTKASTTDDEADKSVLRLKARLLDEILEKESLRQQLAETLGGTMEQPREMPSLSSSIQNHA